MRPLIPYESADAEDGPPLMATARCEVETRLTALHRHSRGQLLGTMRGLLSVTAGNSRWIVPATHAVWIPPHVVHGMRSHGPYAGWSVYVAASHCTPLQPAPAILSVSGLLREAVARAATWCDTELDSAQSQLVGVILNEIATLPQADLRLPMPLDRRLLQIANALSDRPDDDRKLEDWALWAGIAPRTLTRRFSAETGFSLTEWRQRLRLLRSLELLAAGRAVSTVALDVGYQNVSAFIALFKRTFAITPRLYVDMLDGQ